MNVSSLAAFRIDLSGLIDAFAQANAEDSMTNPLTLAQWDILSSYLLPVVLPAGQVLFSRGANDRTLYFVESGSLSVHYQDEKERLRLAMVAAGSLVGEGAFFSHRTRSATVQSSAPSKLWSLTAIRFTELSNRQPAIALALAMAAGSVMAKRLSSRRLRVAVT
jgi:CRP-like cAMP-binding protein